MNIIQSNNNAIQELNPAILILLDAYNKFYNEYIDDAVLKSHVYSVSSELYDILYYHGYGLISKDSYYELYEEVYSDYLGYSGDHKLAICHFVATFATFSGDALMKNFYLTENNIKEVLFELICENRETQIMNDDDGINFIYSRSKITHALLARGILLPA